MSLMKTKPLWASHAVATNMGWQDPVSKEIYVSVPRLLARMEEEERVRIIKSGAVVSEVKEVLSKDDPVILDEPKIDTPAVIVEIPIEEVKEEIVIIETEPKIVDEEPKKKPGRPKKIIGEVVEQSKSVQVIGEVVEYPEFTNVICE